MDTESNSRDNLSLHFKALIFVVLSSGRYLYTGVVDMGVQGLRSKFC